MKNVLRDLETVAGKIRAGHLRMHSPPSVELFRRVPNAFFHATPELFIQTGGATDFHCPGKTFRLCAGEVCVMPSGVSHQEIPVDLQTPYAVLVFMQITDGILIHRAVANEERRITAVKILRHNTKQAVRVFRYLDEIRFQTRLPVRHQSRHRQSLLEVAALALLGELQHGAMDAEGKHSALIVDAEKLARVHLSDPDLSVANLARMLGCSAEHLSRRFRAERGCTLTEWITDERITLAQGLLTDPRCNIAEVGWACGFNAPSYFIRVFRQKTGVTPRTYRQLKG